jgi:hypothetical protein
VNVNPALSQVELDPTAGVEVINMLDQTLPADGFVVDSNGMLSGIGMPNGLPYEMGESMSIGCARVLIMI